MELPVLLLYGTKAMFWIVSLLIALIALLVGNYYFQLQRRTLKLVRKVPSVKDKPLIGDLFYLSRNPPGELT